jgi:hypothetical protein
MTVGSKELQPQHNAWLNSVARLAKLPGSVRDVELRDSDITFTLYF